MRAAFNGFVAALVGTGCTLGFDRDLIPTDSCLGENPGAELFRDDFDGTLANWTTVSGAWVLQSSELVQQSDTTTGTLLAVQDVGDDYRVVATMRRLSGAVGGAMEIVVRAASQAAYYQCNWEPETGDLEIQDTALTTPLAQRTLVLADIPNYSRDQPITMELEVRGAQLRCCLRELPDATLTLTSGVYPTGGMGLQTWLLAAAFDSLRVYAP